MVSKLLKVDTSQQMSSSSKYMCPSSINVANFVSVRLTQRNYLLCKTQVLSLIESKEVTDFISGKMVVPLGKIPSDDSTSTVNNPDFMLWIRIDRLGPGSQALCLKMFLALLWVYKPLQTSGKLLHQPMLKILKPVSLNFSPHYNSLRRVCLLSLSIFVILNLFVMS